ncbi:phage tail protein [Amphibacillus cookii]|uniref:phage tail protein n=1 Tax=Amphibacillus cookii TaxID=767787 RepID=UPI00195CE9C2|nr:hypothetical protein [Amphibacillus cookii]MBM7542355.1 phage-related protein [Amphibacillus cookii]
MSEANDITIFLQSTAGEIKSVIGVIEKQLSNNPFTELAESVNEIAKGFDKSAEQINGFADQTKESFKKIWESVQELNKAFTIWDKLIAANKFVIFATVLATLAMLFVELYQNSETFQNIVNRVFEAVRDFVVPIVEEIADVVTNVWTFITDWWEEHGQVLLEKAQTIFESIWETIQEAMNHVWEIIETVLGKVITFIQEQLEKIQTFWLEHGETIMDAVENIFSFIYGIIETVMDKVQDIIAYVLPIIQNIFERVMPIVKHIIEKTWERIQIVIETVINVILGIIEFFASMFTGDFEGMKEAVLKIWNSIWDGIKGLVDNAWQTVKPAFTALWDSISGWFTDLFNDALDWGGDLIKGFWEGIKGMGSWLSSKVGNLISKVVPGPIKSVLGIASPSKLMKEYGRYTGQGLEIGLNHSRTKLRRASEAMARVIERPISDLDVAGQVNHIHRDSQLFRNQRHQHQLSSQKQSAFINVSIGNQEFRRFVEDINHEQDRIHRTEKSFA